MRIRRYNCCADAINKSKVTPSDYGVMSLSLLFLKFALLIYICKGVLVQIERTSRTSLLNSHWLRRPLSHLRLSLRRHNRWPS